MRDHPIEITCEHCGKKVMMHSYRIKNGTGKYCSQECYFAHRWPNSGKCKGCGKPSKTRFCTPECQRDYWNKNSGPTHRKREWMRKMEIIKNLGGKCSRCGMDDFRCLDIHHIDPSRKQRPKDGSYTMSRRLKDWSANPDNLELLCANCHRLETWEQRGFGSGLDFLSEIKR